MVIRATDPGQRLFQYLTDRGHPIWVHCPRCGGPATDTRRRVVCKRCGYAYGAKEMRPRPGARLTLVKASPACANPACGAPIPRTGRGVRPRDGEELVAEVRCPTCGRTGRYPAYAGRSTLLWSARGWPMRRSPYLWRTIGSHTLWAYNQAHLEALEKWLAADLRERGPVAGLTMMSRLPRWMKAAGMRARVVRALAEMHAQAKKEGLW